MKQWILQFLFVGLVGLCETAVLLQKHLCPISRLRKETGTSPSCLQTKGVLVLVNTADYHNKVNDLLSDTDTYKMLRQDATSSNRIKVMSAKSGEGQSHWQANVLHTVSKHYASILFFWSVTLNTTSKTQITEDLDETMVSYDVISPFTCIPNMVKKGLEQDIRTNFTSDHICALLALLLSDDHLLPVQWRFLQTEARPTSTWDE